MLQTKKKDGREWQGLKRLAAFTVINTNKKAGMRK
jgi:hypothetical protein